jgi:hypothetical protein
MESTIQVTSLFHKTARLNEEEPLCSWLCLEGSLIDSINRAVIIFAYSFFVYKTIERLIRGKDVSVKVWPLF